MERRKFLELTSWAIAELAFNPQPALATERPPLESYLKRLKNEWKRVSTIFESNNPFVGLKDLSKEQRLSDIDMYFPMYKAGEKKFNVPWFMLWIIHTHETTASRHPSPEGSGYRGAMQIAPNHYSKPMISNAPEGWEMLDQLDQRYHQSKGWRTNDWEEILRGAAYIRLFADTNYPYLDNESAILNVVRYNYSAETHGRVRVAKYNLIKSLLGDHSR